MQRTPFSCNSAFYHVAKLSLKHLTLHFNNHLYNHFHIATRCFSATATVLYSTRQKSQRLTKKKYDRKSHLIKNHLIMDTNENSYNYPYNNQYINAPPQFTPSYQDIASHLQSQLQQLSHTNNSTDYTYNYQYQPPQFNSSYPNQPSEPFVPNMSHPKREKKRDGDKKVLPSAASGGVPTPTPEYLRAASLPPFTLRYPRKILVVIDLNGTVLFRPNRRHNPSGFVERTHARTFLSYCIETFMVVIWSSAKPANVNKMCDQLLTPAQREQVVAIWSRDKFGLTPDDYSQRVVCYKRLTALWNDPTIRASHPEFESSGGKKVWDQSNTLLIDDTLEKARSEPFNLVEVPEFTGDLNEPGEVLAQVHDYINTCASKVDVSAYIRTHPFRADPNFVLHHHDAPAHEEARD